MLSVVLFMVDFSRALFSFAFVAGFSSGSCGDLGGFIGFGGQSGLMLGLVGDNLVQSHSAMAGNLGNDVGQCFSILVDKPQCFLVLHVGGDDLGFRPPVIW